MNRAISPGYQPPPSDDGEVRVLLIDEHVLIAEVLQAVFETQPDFEFSYCSDRSAATEFASRIHPTIIFQVLSTPDVPGLDLVRDIRATPALNDVPIVVLSANEDPKAKEEAFSAGADDYLVKLPNEIEIIARVRYHSRAYTTHRELQNTVDKLERVRNQLMQSEKLASIGLLAAGVAHEINNPVAFVTSNLNSLQGYYQDVFNVIDAYAGLNEGLSVESAQLAAAIEPKDKLRLDNLRQDIRQVLDECKDGLSRVRKIVDNLKGFSRSGDTEWQWTDLHEELDRTVGVAINEIKYKADVRKDYGDLPMVQCVPSQINQVILNLLVNAAQAIDDRGAITITTRAGTLPYELRGVDAGNGADADLDAWVCVQVSDTGTGIDAHALQHIFDPFFTTKEAAKGTGLGLSVSLGIIQGHGGHILADSEVGVGTTFSIWLPVEQPGARMARNIEKSAKGIEYVSHNDR